MTLQNGAVIGKRAVLWTDTAYSSADGTELGFGSKALQGLDWPFAVSWTTIGRHPHWIADRVSETAPLSLPALLACCREVLIGFCASPGTMGRLMVAAHDRARGKARLFMIASESMFDQPAFAPMEGISFVSSHSDCRAHQEALGRGFTINRMLDVIDEQRASPFTTALGTPATIGGNCVQIEVSATGVASSVAREWMGAVAA